MDHGAEALTWRWPLAWAAWPEIAWWGSASSIVNLGGSCKWVCSKSFICRECTFITVKVQDLMLTKRTESLLLASLLISLSLRSNRHQVSTDSHAIHWFDLLMFALFLQERTTQQTSYDNPDAPLNTVYSGLTDWIRAIRSLLLEISFRLIFVSQHQPLLTSAFDPHK